MTSDWLAGLKALEAAATKGPWFNTSNGAGSSVIATNPCKEHAHEPGLWIADGSYDRGYDTSPDPWAKEEGANFALIATSRNIFPELIAVINEARLLDQCALGSWECNCQNCRTLRAIDALAGKVVVK